MNLALAAVELDDAHLAALRVGDDADTYAIEPEAVGGPVVGHPSEAGVEGGIDAWGQPDGHVVLHAEVVDDGVGGEKLVIIHGVALVVDVIEGGAVAAEAHGVIDLEQEHGLVGGVGA